MKIIDADVRMTRANAFCVFIVGDSEVWSSATESHLFRYWKYSGLYLLINFYSLKYTYLVDQND